MHWLVGKYRQFRDDERGIALILVSVMLPVIVGFGLLALDMSRASSLHNDLQKGADSFALAAAAELDGSADAWDRADNAMATLVSNTKHFSTASATLDSGGITRRFLKSLPALDSDPITAANLAANPEETQFIEVTVNPVGFAAIFPASFISSTANNSFNIGATAVAGFGSSVCDFTPIYICNPYEGTSTTLAEAVSDPDIRRRMIELRQQGGATAQNSPGNYGFLVPTDGSSGADAIRDMIAQVRSPSCYANRGVEVRPGFIATARDALNVRFDVYGGPMNGKKSNADFAPATNVRKGYKDHANDCNRSEVAEPTAEYERLSRDSCFASNTCPYASGRVGDGNWDFDAYWSQNRFGLTGVSKPVGADGVNPASNSNLPSRYDVYRHEIQNNALMSQSSVGGETGLPGCSNQTAPADVDRRLIYGAIINCQEHDIGNGASGDEVPPEAFASFFLTETVESGADQIIRVELVDITGRFGGGTLEDFARDEAQLYR